MDNLENRLIKLVLKGDQRAFAEIVELYKDKLFHLAYRMLNNRHEAEDVVQETFLRVFRNMESTIRTRSSQPGSTGSQRICVLTDCAERNLHTHWMLN